MFSLTWRVCLKQYVGQTVDEFRNMWNNYESNDRKYLNFNADGHSSFLENVSIRFTEKTDPSDPEK